jgi:hypothetical protein
MVVENVGKVATFAAGFNGMVHSPQPMKKDAERLLDDMSKLSIVRRFHVHPASVTAGLALILALTRVLCYGDHAESCSPIVQYGWPMVFMERQLRTDPQTGAVITIRKSVSALAAVSDVAVALGAVLIVVFLFEWRCRTRPWHSFSSREACVGIAIVSASCAWVKASIDEHTQEQLVLNGAHGGMIQFDVECRAPVWLRKCVGGHRLRYWERVIGVLCYKIHDADVPGLVMAVRQLRYVHTLDCATADVTDAGVISLVAQLDVEHLLLSHTEVGDRAVAVISCERTVRTLFLDETHITDECVPNLARMPRLEVLRLDGTAVTGDALPDLAQCRRLRCLDLSYTGVTAADLLEHAYLFGRIERLRVSGVIDTNDEAARVQRALPSVRLEWSRDDPDE